MSKAISKKKNLKTTKSKTDNVMSNVSNNVCNQICKVFPKNFNKKENSSIIKLENVNDMNKPNNFDNLVNKNFIKKNADLEEKQENKKKSINLSNLENEKIKYNFLKKTDVENIDESSDDTSYSSSNLTLQSSDSSISLDSSENTFKNSKCESNYIQNNQNEQKFCAKKSFVEQEFRIEVKQNKLAKIFLGKNDIFYNLNETVKKNISTISPKKNDQNYFENYSNFIEKLNKKSINPNEQIDTYEKNLLGFNYLVNSIERNKKSSIQFKLVNNKVCAVENNVNKIQLNSLKEKLIKKNNLIRQASFTNNLETNKPNFLAKTFKDVEVYSDSECINEYTDNKKNHNLNEVNYEIKEKLFNYSKSNTCKNRLNQLNMSNFSSKIDINSELTKNNNLNNKILNYQKDHFKKISSIDNCFQDKLYNKNETDLNEVYINNFDQIKKNENINENSLSELKLLRKDLELSNKKVGLLTDQLNTNAQMVAAFEQSLYSMTNRLQQLNKLADEKDFELNLIKEKLKNFLCSDKKDFEELEKLINLNNIEENLKTNKIHRRHTFTNLKESFQLNKCKSLEIYSNEKLTKELTVNKKKNSRQSIDKLFNKVEDKNDYFLDENSKLNTSWLKQSLVKAFKKSSSVKNSPIHMKKEIYSNENNRKSFDSDQSEPIITADKFYDKKDENFFKKELDEKEKQIIDLRLEALTNADQMNDLKEVINKMSIELLSLKNENKYLNDLIKKKSSSVSLASENLSEIENISSLNSNISKNTSIYKNANSLSSNFTPKNNILSIESLADKLKLVNENNEINYEENLGSNLKNELLLNKGYLFTVLIETPFENCMSGSIFNKEVKNLENETIKIGYIKISEQTTWNELNKHLKTLLYDYLSEIDSKKTLGINLETITELKIGVLKKVYSLSETENHQTIYEDENLKNYFQNCEFKFLRLKFNSFLDFFSLKTLLPKAIITNLLDLLLENKRLIIYGPAGTMKTFIAHKLAEYLIIKLLNEKYYYNFDEKNDNKYLIRKKNFDEASTNQNSMKRVETYFVNSRNYHNLNQYFSNLLKNFDSDKCTLPTVIIVDNLQLIQDIKNAFSPFEKNKDSSYMPFIISTIDQNDLSISQNIKFSQPNVSNFNWVIFSNHLEPIQGYLTRYLNKKLHLQSITDKFNLINLNLNNLKVYYDQNERQLLLDSLYKIDEKILKFIKIIDWLDKILVYVNHFIYLFNVKTLPTIGPKTFFEIPVDDLKKAELWFIKCWNESISPHIIQKCNYSSEASFELNDFIKKTYPWLQIFKSK